MFALISFVLHLSIESSHLVGVSVEIEVLQESCGKLAEQEVVRLVDGPHAPVSVVVGTRAGTERTH